MSEQQIYVAGFLFDFDYRNVLLIEKQKPDWQRGKMNGIGGKIEPGELPSDSMIREFLEETGLLVPRWRYFCNLSGDGFLVHFFCAVGDIYLARSMEEERVRCVLVKDVPALNVIPNLRWLIPMAADESRLVASVSEAPKEAAP